MDEAIQLAVKVLSKTMDSTTLTGEKRTCFPVFRCSAGAHSPTETLLLFCLATVEFCTVSKKGSKVVYHVMSDKEVDEYLKKVEPAAPST